MTEAQKLIADFYGKNLIAFYPSGVDGTPCVRVHTFERDMSYEVADLAKSIAAHKRFIASLDAKVSA